MPKTRRSRRRACDPPEKKAAKQSVADFTGSMRGGAVADFLAKVTKLYRAAANPRKAVDMKKYMRDQFEFFGIQSQPRRVISKEVFKQLRQVEPPTIREILELLWQQNEREYQYLGLDMANDKTLSLCGASKEEYLTTTRLLKKLITTKSWWDTVDALAGVVGSLAQSRADVMGPVMEKWINDENMWVRRVAILHQLSYKENTDKEKLFRFCRQCAHEEDFFIRKAIGWSLRQYSKVNPKDVKAFVEENEDELSSLSKREALKYT